MATGAMAPPPHHDARNARGSNYVTPIRDQGACGSCVAFAIAAVMESRLALTEHAADPITDLSEAHLFFGRKGATCSNGWYPTSGLKVAQKPGVGLEADFPYEPHDQAGRDIAPAARIKRFRSVDDPEERKRVIATKGPVVGGMHVYADFGWYRGNVYSPSTSMIRARHAVAVIGYDDSEGCWIIKNSWGAAWGEQGFARIAYGACGLDSEFPFYDVEVERVPGGARH